MKQEQKKYLIYATLILLGIIIGYLLFFNNNAVIPNGSSGSSSCASGTTTTTPTEEGDRICTRVCVPKPPVCRDPTPECPPGTTWSCSGTLTMNCGCYPPTTPINPTTDTTGARGCLIDPSVCSTSEYCDTSLNQCISLS